MSAILGPEYREAVERLKRDEHLFSMVPGILSQKYEDLAHEDGTPRFTFMAAANAEYERRAGHHADGHMGAVAETLLAFYRFLHRMDEED